MRAEIEVLLAIEDLELVVVEADGHDAVRSAASVAGSPVQRREKRKRVCERGEGHAQALRAARVEAG